MSEFTVRETRASQPSSHLVNARRTGTGLLRNASRYTG